MRSERRVSRVCRLWQYELRQRATARGGNGNGNGASDGTGGGQCGTTSGAAREKLRRDATFAATMQVVVLRVHRAYELQRGPTDHWTGPLRPSASYTVAISTVSDYAKTYDINCRPFKYGDLYHSSDEVTPTVKRC